MQAIEKAKTIPAANLLYALGIKGIGLSIAKLIVKEYPLPLDKMHTLTTGQLAEIDGIGDVLAESFVSFFAKEDNQQLAQQLSAILSVIYPQETEANALDGLTFVITGSLSRFENRQECKDFIERQGGKVTGSVSAKTNYLINNDVHSQSSKNKKAKSLGVAIIDEDEFFNIFSL